MHKTKVEVTNIGTYVEIGPSMYPLRYILSLHEFNQMFFEPKKYKLFGFTVWTSRKNWKYHLKKAILEPRMEEYYFDYI